MKSLLWILLFPFLVLFAACEDEMIAPEPPQLVVEGWVEANGLAVVRISSTLAVVKDYQSVDSLIDHVIQEAKVFVSDGEKRHQIDCKLVPNHLTPYEYRGNFICRAGRTYTLSVDCDYAGRTYHLESEAYVPEPCGIDTAYAEFVRCDEAGDSLFQIVVKPTQDGKVKAGRCFVQTDDSQSEYLLAPLSLLPAERVVVLNPMQQGGGVTETYFHQGEVVNVKCVSMDEVGDAFWTDFEQSLYLSRNFLMPLTQNIYSNIQGGLGYWLGYGSTTYHLEIH